MTIGVGMRSRARSERRPAAALPPREAPEQVVARLRRSGRHLVWPSLFFIAICFGTGYFWNVLPYRWMDAALPFVAAGLAVILSVLPLVFWLNRVTVLTTRRVVVTQGFVVRERTEFPLGRATDAVLKRGPLQLLTGSGDVHVHAGADGVLVLRDMPRARLVQRALAELIGG